MRVSLGPPFVRCCVLGRIVGPYRWGVRPYAPTIRIYTRDANDTRDYHIEHPKRVFVLGVGLIAGLTSSLTGCTGSFAQQIRRNMAV